jgi:Protein of unknown function (DUF2752)
MRVSVKKRETGGIEFGIIYGGIAALMLCAARFLPLLLLLPSCAFKGLTGIPCPTCGATRSVVYLARGEITASLVMNPLVSVCFIATVAYFVYSSITLVLGIPRLCIHLTEQEKDATRAAGAVIALVNWMYLIYFLS